MRYDRLDPYHISTSEINKITKKTGISIVTGILHTMTWAILFGAMLMFTLFGIAYYDYLINYNVFVAIGLTVMSCIFFLFNLFETIHKVRRSSR